MPDKPGEKRFIMVMPQSLYDHIARRLKRTERTMPAELRFLLKAGLDAACDPVREEDEAA